MNVQIIIPIYYPDDKFIFLLKKIKKQTIKNIPVLIIDSGSTESYLNEVSSMDVCVKKIKSTEFNHGKTREMGMQMNPLADVYIFFTQDAILVEDTAIENLIKVFNNINVGCAYGRQIPHNNADLFAMHARLFNYQENSFVHSIKDRVVYGMKTVFISNSFAAYRKVAIEEIGGFPSSVILGEDMYVAAKMLKNNWLVGYVAAAKVYHSHNYTIWQEFKRYFDIGVFHGTEKWIRESFGEAEGEGKKFVVSEIKYILKHKPLNIFELILRNAMKLIGYKLGLKEKVLSKAIKCRLSMNSKYWW